MPMGMNPTMMRAMALRGGPGLQGVPGGGITGQLPGPMMPPPAQPMQMQPPMGGGIPPPPVPQRPMPGMQNLNGPQGGY